LRRILGWAKLTIRYREPVECPVCGDGKIQSSDPTTGSGQEQCDDGNLANGDGCDSQCQLEGNSCLKINEVYYYPGVRCADNGKCEKDPRDEWIELYNACPFTVNIKDWRLTDNQTDENLNHNYQITGHQFVVIAANASTWKYWPHIPDNALRLRWAALSCLTVWIRTAIGYFYTITKTS